MWQQIYSYILHKTNQAWHGGHLQVRQAVTPALHTGASTPGPGVPVLATMWEAWPQLQSWHQLGPALADHWGQLRNEQVASGSLCHSTFQTNIRELAFNMGSDSCSCLPIQHSAYSLKNQWGMAQASGDQPKSSSSCTCVGDWEEAPGSQLHSSSALAVVAYWGVNQEMEISVSLPFFL